MRKKRRTKRDRSSGPHKVLNPTCSYRAIEEHVSERNAMELLKDADVVLDCTDNQRASVRVVGRVRKVEAPLVIGRSELRGGRAIGGV